MTHAKKAKQKLNASPRLDPIQICYNRELTYRNQVVRIFEHKLGKYAWI